MLFSSHQLDLVEHLCQDVVVVHHGRVVLAGVLEELRAAARRRVIDLAIGNGDGWTSQLGGVEVAERGPGHLRLWATAGGSRVQLRTYPQLASGRTRCGAARSTCCWSTAPSWFGGKILGIGLLALGQLLLVTVAASVTATMVDAVDIPRLQPGLVAWLLAWFVVGFALWAVVYGALGALAGRSEDSQAVSAPATVVLTASYLFALFSMPAHPVLAPPAQAAAGEGLDATSQQRHAEEGQDKARARIPH